VDFFKTRVFLRLWRAQQLIDCKNTAHGEQVTSSDMKLD